MLNGKQLRARFHQFNEQYFGGRLPPYGIRVVKRVTWLGESGSCYKKRRLIEIRAGQSDEEAVPTLLHEMAHAATRGRHGMPWKKEMIRLREAGAPFTDSDKFVKLEGWDGRIVSRRHFRGFVDDFLLDDNFSTVTVHDAIRWFISNQGGPETVAAFLRRYPWARATFRAAKKQRAEFEKQRQEYRKKTLRRHGVL